MPDSIITKSYSISHPNGQLIGRVDLPGSKSISNRLLVLKQLYFPDLKIEGISDGEDTVRMQSCLNDKGNFIHVGEAGTVMRFLTALYSVMEHRETVLMGSPRMHERPIGILVESLKKLGVQIAYLERQGYPPVKIYGRKLDGGEVSLDAGVSSQFISALMMIAPSMSRGLTIKLQGLSISAPYIFMTARIMNELGFKVEVKPEGIRIASGVPHPKESYKVEADWSAASYWFLMAQLSERSEIYLPGLHYNSAQGDAQVTHHFFGLGVEAVYQGSGYHLKKLLDTKPLPDRINLVNTPDLAQSLSVAYAAADHPVELQGLQSLRIKETDRIRALENELSKTGAVLSVGNDYLRIESGLRNLQGLSFETYNDHRMAMAFATLGLMGEIEIADPDVVQKSYPNFWKHLSDLGFKIQSKS